LTAIVLTLGPISGAHFNPVITVSMGATGNLPWREVYAYLSAQLVGAFAGVVSAHWMFGQPWISMSHHSRNGGAQLWREAVATFGLRLIPVSPLRDGLRSGCVHYGGALVHRIHLLRESGCDPCARG
jgi:glycerol uptake facilitator-like aquaporin